MEFEISKHGTTGSYDKGCRCEICKKAKSDYRKKAPIKEHGKKWSYDKGCRCSKCREAKNLAVRKQYGRQPQKVTTDVIAGTRKCYVCKEIKLLEEFGANKNRRAYLGRSNDCKICKNKRSRENKNKPEQRFSVYKSGARVRKIEFNLSFEQFMHFWCLPCYYCSSIINGIGLDRKDPKRGYDIENIVPCCGRCNRAKTIQTTEEFISMCLKVAEKFKNHIVDPKTN